ncbi:MAG TPA: hypothetical protein VF534_23920 [Paraburkholderia sp.]
MDGFGVSADGKPYCLRVVSPIALRKKAPEGLAGVLLPVVAQALRIQMDTSLVADLSENIQYDSGDHREPETILQTNWQRRLNNQGQVPLIL